MYRLNKFEHNSHGLLKNSQKYCRILAFWLICSASNQVNKSNKWLQNCCGGNVTMRNFHFKRTQTASSSLTIFTSTLMNTKCFHIIFSLSDGFVLWYSVHSLPVNGHEIDSQSDSVFTPLWYKACCDYTLKILHLDRSLQTMLFLSQFLKDS